MWRLLVEANVDSLHIETKSVNGDDMAFRVCLVQLWAVEKTSVNYVL
jgi:hypothetical protein